MSRDTTLIWSDHCDPQWNRHIVPLLFHLLVAGADGASCIDLQRTDSECQSHWTALLPEFVLTNHKRQDQLYFSTGRKYITFRMRILNLSRLCLGWWRKNRFSFISSADVDGLVLVAFVLAGSLWWILKRSLPVLIFNWLRLRKMFDLFAYSVE